MFNISKLQYVKIMNLMNLLKKAPASSCFLLRLTKMTCKIQLMGVASKNSLYAFYPGYYYKFSFSS